MGAQVRDGVPHAFTFWIVNRSKRALWVAEPAINCSNNLVGSLTLQTEFTPAAPGSHRLGYGCNACFGQPPDILERVKAWKVLQPGESLIVEADLSKLRHLDVREVGTYRFTARYQPPYVSPAEQARLAALGMAYVSQSLESEAQVFRKDQ